MPTNYPNDYDDFSNPTAGTSQQTSRSHSEQHSDLNDAVEALQAYVGTNAGGTNIAFLQSGTGAVARTVQDKARDIIDARDFGLSAGDADSYAKLIAAMNAANTAGATLRLPAGTFTINQASPVFPLLDNTEIIGAGPGRTVIYFTDTLDSTTDVFSVTGKSNIRIKGISLVAQSLRTGGNNAFQFLDCVDCTIEDCTQDKFTQGFVFDRSAGAIPPTTTNLRNKAVRCVSKSSRSYGFLMNFATACEFLHCEAYNASNQDGFKSGGGSTFCKMIGCHSEGNNQDGFDTYDGWIASVIADCTAYNNTAAGFQFKGTLGGTYASGDYVNRESVYSNLVARGNAINGFLFQEMRNAVVSGLVATENVGSGIVVNNCQAVAFSSSHAIRNTQHGWSLIGGTSRCTFSSCIALDNSYVDGTTQNGTYDGFNLNTTGTCIFTACYSLNGTQSGKFGGQGYGFNTTTSSGNVFSGCAAQSNVTGPVGGTTPYASNSFNSILAAGNILGWAANGNAGEVNLERNGGNATANVTRTGAAAAYLQAQSTFGAVGTVGSFELRLTTGTTGRWAVGTSGHFTPLGDNVYDVGSGSNRARVIYAGTGTINTSDAREKQQVRALSEAERAVAVKCKGLLRAYKFNDAVAGKGEAARIHFGVMAQDVLDAFQSEGLDANLYGLLCYDEWDAREEETDDDGNVVTPARASGNRYGIRYDELLAFIVAAL